MENMENMEPQEVRRPNPRRKKRSPFKRFIRAYLPLLVVVVLIILFIVFAVGSVKRANEKREQARQESLAVASSIAQQQFEWESEALAKIAESEKYAAACEYDKAIAVLDTFSGNLYDFDNLVLCRQGYQDAESKLVPWEDPRTVPFLSFSKLIADPVTGFGGTNGSDNRYSYISTAEFTAILQQLFDNGFMLVDLDDIFTTTKAEDGATLIVKNELKLPAGKKPIVLIQCQPSGYENALVLKEDGSFATKMTPEGGESYEGSYDFVPLLEDFIASHPGFSLRGARAVLALTGNNGLFGYPLEDTANITAVVNALKEKGYTLASNTYSNARYGKISLLEMQEDIANWENLVKPLLGETEILAYARSSDISDSKESYNSTKYEKLYVAGFRYYMGICYNSNPWMNITDNTIRMGRIMVTGNGLKESASLYANLFDASAVYGAK